MAAVVDPLKPSAPPSESLSRVVWALAWPAVALNSLQVVNALLDRGFIGHLPPEALTAHGASMSVMFLYFSIAAAIGTAATALVSRAYGAGQVQEFRDAGRQCLNLSLLGGVVMAMIGLTTIGLFQGALIPATDPEARSQMGRFLGVYMLGLPAIYLVQTLAGSLRGIGDTKSPMVISGIQILLHIVLNVLLIFPAQKVALAFGLPVIGDVSLSFRLPGAGLGLTGAAAALTLSAWIAAIGYLLWSGKTPLGAAWRIALPTKAWMSRIMRIATPAAGSAGLRVGSFMIFTAILAQTADASVALAGMSVGIAIESIMFMPTFGLAMATSALVGQSLGAKQPDRAERVGWLAGHHGAIVMVVLSIPLVFGADWIASIMVGTASTDPDALLKVAQIRETAAEYIRYMCSTQALVAYAMVLIGALQGAGDTVKPMWITVVSMLLIRAPIAWLLALPLGLGSLGAWIAMALTQGLQGLLAMHAFRQGEWKSMKV